MIILTDLSEVLIKGLYGIEDRIRDLYGVDASKQFITRKHETEGLFNDLMRGCITEDRYWSTFLSIGHWPFGLQEIKSLFSLNLAETIPGTYELYCGIIKYPVKIVNHQSSKKRLKGRPEIWIVSDHIAERKTELELLHPELFALASRCIWSFDEVALKSDPGFFHRLIKKNSLDPTETFLIDDSVDNIYGASKAFIPCAWFHNHIQLRYTMKRRGFWFAKNTK